MLEPLWAEEEEEMSLPQDVTDDLLPPHRQFNQNMPPSVVLLQQCHCWNRLRGKLQNLSPPSVLLESSRIFLQYT